MSPEFIKQWEHLVQGVEMTKVPVEFISKMIIKFNGDTKKQHTINIKKLLEQGLEPEQVEELVTKKLDEMSNVIRGVQFVLNIESVAKKVQPQTDKILGKL
jgi:CheY-specific phosphatase CheX